MSFRCGVTHKKNKVWNNNGNKDLFTGWKRNKVEDEHTPEVDHILECQFGELIWDLEVDESMKTRTRLNAMKNLWNGVDNLNVTPGWLNQKKGDAFEVWLEGMEDTLWSSLCRYNVASNHRAKIIVAFEETVVWVCDRLDTLEDRDGYDVYGDFACTVAEWNESIGN